MIMTDSPIRFPGLFGDWAFTASSKAINIGHGIYWYGIIIACGLLLAVIFCLHQRKNYGITEDDLMDCILWGIPCGIIGARLYYVIFYLDLFRDADGRFSWSKAIAIWDGGLAIYGTVIAVVLLAIIMAKRKGFKLCALTDLVVMGLLIGQIVGRWGNFMNREAHGGVTDSFFKMGLLDAAGNVTYYHPTFLYESVWNLVGFIGLHCYCKKRKFDGEIFLLYVAWYGLGRVWIEGLRTDSLYLFSTGIRVSQLVAGVSFVVAAGAICYVLARKKPNPEQLFVNRQRRADDAPVEDAEKKTEEM